MAGFLDSLRDAQYLYEVGIQTDNDKYFDASRDICVNLQHQSKLPLYMRTRVYMLLFNRSDDWDHKEDLRLQAEGCYESMRGTYPEGQFTDVDATLAAVAEDLEVMAEHQAEVGAHEEEEQYSQATVSEDVGANDSEHDGSDIAKGTQVEGGSGAKERSTVSSEPNKASCDPVVAKKEPSPLSGGKVKAAEVHAKAEPFDVEAESQEDLAQDAANQAKEHRRLRIRRETEKHLVMQGLLADEDKLSY